MHILLYNLLYMIGVRSCMQLYQKRQTVNLNVKTTPELSELSNVNNLTSNDNIILQIHKPSGKTTMENIEMDDSYLHYLNTSWTCQFSAKMLACWNLNSYPIQHHHLWVYFLGNPYTLQNSPSNTMFDAQTSTYNVLVGYRTCFVRVYRNTVS